MFLASPVMGEVVYAATCLYQNQGLCDLLIVYRIELIMSLLFETEGVFVCLSLYRAGLELICFSAYVS